MRLRQGKWLLQFLCILQGLVTIAICYWAWTFEPAVATGARATKTESVPTELATTVVEAISPETLQRRLRDPLYDPEKVVVQERPPIPPSVTLVGTIFEPGNSIAMLQLPTGAVEIRRVGQSLNDGKADFELMEIQKTSIVLKQGAKTFKITSQTQD
jgi:hypothetical protein